MVQTLMGETLRRTQAIQVLVFFFNKADATLDARRRPSESCVQFTAAANRHISICDLSA